MPDQFLARALNKAFVSTINILTYDKDTTGQITITQLLMFAVARD